MNAKDDLLKLASLPPYRAATDKRARAVVARHADVIRASLAQLAGLPTFSGRTVKDALAYFVELDVAFKKVQARIKRETGLHVGADAVHGEVKATITVVKGRGSLLLATKGKGAREIAPCNAFFSRLLRFPRVAEAVELVLRPHDEVIPAAFPWAWCVPRPPRKAPRAELLRFLFERKDSWRATERERAELEAFALAHVKSARIPKVRARSEDEHWLVDVDFALRDSGIRVTICERGRSLELESLVVLGDLAHGGDGSVESAALQSAIEARLATVGASTERILDVIERLDMERVAGKLESVVHFKTNLRTKPRPWAKMRRLAKTAARA